MLTKNNLEYRVRNTFYKAYGIVPIYSINLQHQLEIHTGDWDKRTQSLGFIYLREGYFCSVWELPESMLGDNWRG